MGNWRIVVWLVVVLAAATFLYLVRSILAPFILAWFIAVLLDPIVRGLGKKGIPRPASVLLLTAGFFGLLIGIGLLVAPKLSRQANDVRIGVQSFTEALAEDTRDDNVFVRWNPAILAKPPGPLGKVDEFVESNTALMENMGLPTTRRLLTKQFLEPQRQNITAGVNRIFNGAVNFLSIALPQVVLLSFTPIFVIFLLLDLDLFRKRIHRWIPPILRAQTMAMIDDMGDVFQSYIRGVLINISLYTVVMAVALTVLGTPFSLLLAIMAGILYLIPNLGGILSLIVIVTVTLLSGRESNWFAVFPSPVAFAALQGIGFFCVTTIWDMAVTPRVVGKSVRLHPFFAMFVVFSGGALFGLIGMVLAYPVAGVVKLTLERIMSVTHRQSEQRLELPAVPLRHREA